MQVGEGDKKAIARRVWETVKWFNERNAYGFINRNDTEGDVSVHHEAPCSVGEGETVEFDVVEREKGGEAANYKSWWSSSAEQ